MTDWLAENWPVLLCAVCYAVERVSGVSAAWRKRAAWIMDAMERESRLPGTQASLAKELVPEEARGDELLDSVLDDTVQPKPERRVPVGKRVGRFLLNLLPVAARFL